MNYGLGRSDRLSANDKADIETGPAHIGRDDVAFPYQPTNLLGANNTADGTRQQRCDRLMPNIFHRTDAPDGLHNQNRTMIPVGLQRVTKIGQVLLQQRI